MAVASRPRSLEQSGLFWILDFGFGFWIWNLDLDLVSRVLGFGYGFLFFVLRSSFTPDSILRPPATTCRQFDVASERL